LGFAVVLVLAPIAAASTTFGSTLGASVGFGAFGNTVSTNVAAANTSATAPFDGVVTAFRVKHGRAAASPGAYAWRILTGAASPFDGRPATPSGQNDVYLAWPPNASPGIETWFPTDAQGHAVGVPIRAGELIALWTEKMADGSAAPAFGAFSSGARYLRHDGSDHVSGSQAYAEFGGLEALIQGTIEPDADGDHYGDETQDPCPAVSGLGPCPAPQPTPQVVVVTNTVTKTNTIACAVGTRPAGDHCAKIVCPPGRRLSVDRCVKACPRGKRLNRNRCVKRKPHHRAKRP
jgi:hypothetical protein